VTQSRTKPSRHLPLQQRLGSAVLFLQTKTVLLFLDAAMDVKDFALVVRNTDQRDFEHSAATADSDTKNLESLGVLQVGAASFP
jgi:hypothetical protein